MLSASLCEASGLPRRPWVDKFVQFEIEYTDVAQGNPSPTQTKLIGVWIPIPSARASVIFATSLIVMFGGLVIYR